MRVIAVLDTIGTHLLLQLGSLLLSIPLVTALPATVAFERAVADLARGGRVGFTDLVKEFWSAWRTGWPLGVLAAVLGVGFAVSFVFWFKVGGAAGHSATAVLAALLGLVGGMLLTVLVAAERERGAGVRVWVRAGWVVLAARPLRALWGLVLLLCWIALASAFPALLVAGSSLAPALIARWTILTPAERRDESRQASRS